MLARVVRSNLREYFAYVVRGRSQPALTLTAESHPRQLDGGAVVCLPLRLLSRVWWGWSAAVVPFSGASRPPHQYNLSRCGGRRESSGEYNSGRGLSGSCSIIQITRTSLSCISLPIGCVCIPSKVASIAMRVVPSASRRAMRRHSFHRPSIAYGVSSHIFLQRWLTRLADLSTYRSKRHNFPTSKKKTTGRFASTSRLWITPQYHEKSAISPR